MPFASNNGGGDCFAFPDVCLTPAPPAPPVPIPYPNTAMLTQGDGGTFSSKVKIVGKKAATKISEITMSSGDEAGNAPGGQVSGKFKGSCKFKQGSSKVKIEGNEAAYHGALIGQNDASNSNIPPGHQVSPSQTKVTVAP
jgi:uncharacterized Zn-binding protein involved in type VI secretion